MERTLEVDTLFENADWIRDLVRRLVRDQGDVDDVVQQTWMAALRSPPKTLDSPRGWLTQVARRFAWQIGRRDGARRAAETAVARPEVVVPTAAQRLELHRRLVDAVGALDETYQTVVVLRYFEGLPPREIARRLALPATTVRNRLSRALDQLRQRLDDRFDGRVRWCLALMPLALGGRRGVGVSVVAAAVVLFVGVVSWSTFRSGAVDTLRAVGRPASETSGPVARGPAAVGVKPPLQAADAALASVRGGASRPALVGFVVADDVAVSGARVEAYAVEASPASRADVMARTERRDVGEPPVEVTTTDAAGRWEFVGLGTSPCRIEVKAAGFARATVASWSGGDAVLSVTLHRAGVFEGVVIDPDGDPVVGATVDAISGIEAGVELERPRTTRTVTARDGTFSVDVEPLVERVGWGAWWLDRLRFEPDLREMRLTIRHGAFASLVQVPCIGRRRDDGRVVFELRPPRPTVVRVQAPAGCALLLGVRVFLRLPGRHYDAIRFLDASGAATFADAPDGADAFVAIDAVEWRLSDGDGDARGSELRRKTIVPGPGGAFITVAIEHAPRLSVRVAGPDGVPVPDLSVEVARAAGPRDAHVAWTRLRTDADGRASIAYAPLADARVRVAPGQAWCGLADESLPVDEPQAGAREAAVRQDPADPGARVVRSGLVEPVLIRVARSATICGQLVDGDGRPVGGLAFECVPPGMAGVTDAGGLFRVAGVPSRVALRLRSRGAAGDLSLDVGSVAAGESIDLGTRVLATARPFTVRVESAAGDPVAGLRVDWFAGSDLVPHRARRLAQAVTDATGTARAFALPSGPSSVFVEDPWMRGLALPRDFDPVVTFDAGSGTERVIRLAPLTVVRGIVEDDDARPVGGAWVVVAPVEPDPSDVAFWSRLLKLPPDADPLRLHPSLRAAAGACAGRTSLDGEFSIPVDGSRPYGVVRVMERSHGVARDTASAVVLDAPRLDPGGVPVRIRMRR